MEVLKGIAGILYIFFMVKITIQYMAKDKQPSNIEVLITVVLLMVFK